MGRISFQTGLYIWGIHILIVIVIIVNYFQHLWFCYQMLMYILVLWRISGPSR